MNPIFLDTSGLIAVVNTDDQWHAKAQEVWQRLLASQEQLITSSLVLVEIGDGLSRVQHRRLAVDLHDRVRASPRIEVIQVDPEEEERAWELFRKRDDKEWGMTDCVSMILMQIHQARDVFSLDRHFEQAGFNVLLKRQAGV